MEIKALEMYELEPVARKAEGGDCVLAKEVQIIVSAKDRASQQFKQLALTAEATTKKAYESK